MNTQVGVGGAAVPRRDPGKRRNSSKYRHELKTKDVEGAGSVLGGDQEKHREPE